MTRPSDHARTRGSRTPRRRAMWAVLRWTTRLVLYGALFAVCALAGMVTSAFPKLGNIERNEAFHHYVGTVFARDGTTELRKLRAPTSQRYVRASAIPPVMAHAAVAAEDHRYYQHLGIDPRGILRAAREDLRAGAITQGGSTITQQLVKNTYVGPQRSLGRKSREALLALALDARWSKQRVLTAYLNTSYFGQGAYGVSDAARTWFGTSPQRLGLAESALLAGMLRAPEQESPLHDPASARARRDHVIDEMVKLGFATPAAARRAKARSLPATRNVIRRARRWSGGIAPHFTDDVVTQLVDRYGVAQALGGGLRVVTTLDADMQRAARSAVGRITGTGLGASLVAVDVKTGEVRALVNGGTAAGRAFDVATTGHRQPGSAFKPFTLLAAYGSGFSPQSRVVSAPFVRRVGSDVWRVTNSSGTYSGATPLERAAWHSDNTVFARVADKVGIESVIRAARASGISSRIDPVPATVLGALPEGVTPLELAHAYATIANHGMRAGDQNGSAIFLRRITDPVEGRILGTDAEHAAPRRRINAGVADQVTSTLRGVIREGTGTRAAIGRPAAGKTGTTEAYADAWFVGYTPDLAVAVWVGNPDRAESMATQFGGGPVMGGTFPALIWHDFMSESLAGTPVRQFDLEAARYVTVFVDPVSRLLADIWCVGAQKERFVAGLEPHQHATTCASRERPTPRLTGRQAVAAIAALDRQGFTHNERLIGGVPNDRGTVYAQNPPPGTPLRRGDSITLYVVE